MKIDLAEFYAMMKYKNAINAAPIETLEIYKNGERIHIDQKDIKDWKFFGLSNCDFVGIHTIGKNT